ncbi:MAG: site-specific integrase [Pyrinomonadaceae bacterium]
MERKRSATKYWKEINGVLYARLQYRDESGKPRDKYRKITDKRKAAQAVSEMRRDLELHGEEILNAEKLTFAELLEKYSSTELVEATFQAGVKIGGRRSLGAAKSAVKPLNDYFGHRRVQSIKAADIKNYKNIRLNTPVTMEVNVRTQVLNEKTGKTKTVITKSIKTRERRVATVNRELEILRAIFNFAVMNEWLTKNPFALLKGVISKAAEVERDRVLSFDEERRLLAACVGRRAHLKSLLVCALDTAMRRGEILKMRWRDVDLAVNEINIPQTNTKTETARTVGITERLKKELEAMWETSQMDPQALVFGLTNTIKTAFGSACEDAKLEDFRFHDCRHTATTRMIASGSSHTEVMKITGHTQLKTFLRYLNITPETTRRVALNLDIYLNKHDVLVDVQSELALGFA